MSLSKTGQIVKTLVTSKYDEYQTKLRKEEETLVSLKEEIEKKGAVWSEDVRTQKEREFNRRVQALEEETKYATKDMKEFEKKTVEPILKELETIIAEFGKAEGYSVILDSTRGAVLYEAAAVDISTLISEELDKRHSDSEKK